MLLDFWRKKRCGNENKYYRNLVLRWRFFLHHCGGAVRADVYGRQGGEPIISNGPENKFEFRYNTSPQRSFAHISGISLVRPPTHGAMLRAFKLLYFQKEKEPPTQNREQD